MSASRLTLSFVFLLLNVAVAVSQVPTTRHRNGLKEHVPSAWALTGASVVVSPDRSIEGATVLVRDGKVEAIGDVKVPAGARVVDLKGKTIYPGLIDAFTEQSVSTDALQKGSPYWNEQIRPQLSVAGQFKVDASLNKKLRAQGVTARLVAPLGGVLRGSGSVVLTSDEPRERLFVARDVTQHARLTVPRSRGDQDDYPSSPMGAVALARQAMLDADWYGRAQQAVVADPSLPLPETNDALQAIIEFAHSHTPLVVGASNELFVLRADRFAREFQLNIVVRGSGNEYRRIDDIKRTNRPLLIPVDFPKPPNVATAESARNVRLESLMHWDHAPENPARLAEAGITFALCSHGLDDKSDFLGNVRRAVRRGLDETEALRALTTTPAELFGVDDQCGSIAVGKLANLLVTDGPLFADGTKIFETWVAGHRFELQPEAARDVEGVWSLALEQRAGKPQNMTLEVKRDKELSAAFVVGDADAESTRIKLSRVALAGARLSATAVTDDIGLNGVSRITMTLDGDESASGLGQVVWPDGVVSSLTARKAAAVPLEEDANNVQEKEEDDSTTVSEKPASFAVNFPLGAFGRSSEPEQSGLVAFTNATVWTCGPDGILKKATVLVRSGRVVAVGKGIDIPDEAKVVDASGQHITPGIIDCHSHMATDGGINEGTQAITCEVRIGDFIDCDDISIYRQLAGGVTSSNILHGSANPIGGQNQVIKLRWGQNGEAMKFTQAPQGVKFALGENVKQSNWGDEYTTRYPQTRMGVEQIYRDTFQAAREYEARWDAWNRAHQGLPPRRDLELEAIAEILAGTRWIHCHSYRQDEILMLIRVLDDHDITIGTFQHILEGYKVADAMAKHGAMGSAFSDWWAYKFEVYDAIPFAGALMHDAGVVVSFNSDDAELATHLNDEAAKAVKYGGVPPAEALKFVTLNPAKQLRIDQHVGSLEPGKDADLVLWSGNPLSTFSRCEQTWIDGRKYFDRNDDDQLRREIRQRRNVLIQKILASGEKMRAAGEGDKDPASLWPREDLYCGHHHEGHGHDH